MTSKNHLYSKVKMEILFAGLVFLIAATAKGTDFNEIVLKVVGPDGKALAGAKIYQSYSIQDGNQRGEEYICDKNGLVGLTEQKIFQYEHHRKGVVLYGLYESNLAGFIEASATDLGKELEIKLTPACRVYGKLSSAELEGLEQKLEWTNVCVYRKRGREWLLSYISKQGDFEFLLPAGRYELYAYGTRLYGREEDIEITAKQKVLEKNFDLLADRLANLIGKDAPELQQIKGWINSRKIKLADLRGKVVLLDFWGTWCGPCVAEIPELINLHEKYHNKGLFVIGIHDDSMESVRVLKKKIGQLSKERWAGRKIPFAVALDGGGRYEIEGTKLTAQGATTAAYGIQGWPTMVLIDKQGKVVKEYNRGGDSEVLEKLLAEDIDNKP
jgi:thiol-disulfide isomerase/thioredoxin